MLTLAIVSARMLLHSESVSCVSAYASCIA